jgi:hypothetical protein
VQRAEQAAAAAWNGRFSMTYVEARESDMGNSKLHVHNSELLLSLPLFFSCFFFC